MQKITRTIAAAVLGAALVTTAVAPAEAAPRHTVTLVATASAPATVTAAGNGVVVQKKDRTNYKRVFTKKAYGYYSVSVFNFDGGSVSCKILVDGKVKRSKKATGSFASVDCTL